MRQGNGEAEHREVMVIGRRDTAGEYTLLPPLEVMEVISPLCTPAECDTTDFAHTPPTPSAVSHSHWSVNARPSRRVGTPHRLGGIYPPPQSSHGRWASKDNHSLP